MSNILPFNKTVIQIAVRFSLDISMLTLNQSATFRATLYDVEDKVIDAINVTIEGDDYTKWSNNDDYVVEFISKKLGFTRIN